MKNRFSFAMATVCSAAAVLLAGCGAAGSFPSVDPGTSPIGEIHGVNMGGHAPLTGSHIYLLEAGNTGYGSVAKSLISSSASGAVANGSWTNSGYSTDLFVPSVDASGNAIYGFATDSLGSFTLTGDYTCDVGRVVYLVGVGGNPGLSGTAVSVTQVQVVSLSGSGASETAAVTLTFSSSPGYSAGSNLSFSGFSGSFQSATGINGTTSVVTSASGSTASVSIPDPNGVITAGTYAVSGTATPSYYNHAAVNVAVLGTCPASGNFASSIPYIYLNEVSTVAAAYAFQPYVATSGTNQTGIDEFHIGSSSTTLGLQGIQNAAANAANLYDITGVANPTHIARSVLPTNSSGTVPQAKLDTIANVLAGCVDSGNSYRNGVGTLQASCQTLFQYASSNGVYDTSAGNSWTLSTSTDAFNTFQAAVNMARFPQGAGVGSTSSGTQTVTTAFSATTASSYTSALYALETGTVPFTPNLHSTSAGAPNNFTVTITITGNGLNDAQLLAIDGLGNAWVANYGSSSVSKFSPAGAALLDLTGNGLNGPYGIAIDSSNNAWVTNYTGNSYSKFANGGGALLDITGSEISTPYGITIDGSGYVWVAESGNNTERRYSSAGALSGGLNIAATPYGIGIDGSGIGWVTTSSGTIDKIAANGNTSVGTVSGSGLTHPFLIAMDGSGNGWMTDTSATAVFKVSNAGTVLLDITGNGLSNPYGIAIDGTGNAWVVNNGGNSVSRFSSGGTALLDLTGNGLSLPEGIAVDGSGDVWVSSFSGSVTEFIGAAPPVITPLCAGLPSTASSNGTSSLGTRP